MIAPLLAEARRALAANRLRSFLTMLGMMIGVAAVIVMVALGRGAEYVVDTSIAAMGTNLLVVLSGSAQAGGVRTGAGNLPTLTVADAAAIASLPAVAATAPILTGSVQAVHGAANWGTGVLGTTPSFFPLRNWALASGRPFDESDLRSATRVAVLGARVAEKLFGAEDPVGKTVRLARSPYLVTGVLAAKGQSLDGQEQDDVVVIPVSTAQTKLFGGAFAGTVRFILVQAANASALPAAQAQATALLRQRHRITQGKEDDFSVRNLAALVATRAEATRSTSILLGAIASISLLVGGIGIMNIMLVSVTERTREIGIRCAVGARTRDILVQFLLEAVVLSVSGCLLGVVLGVGAAALVHATARSVVIVTGSSILAAFLVAAAVGIFFGFYPARQAARLDPIEALRYQ